MLNVQTDSRKIKKGDTFIAIKGINGDGHDYINAAIENGATKIVCEHGSYDVETIIVDDTTKYLENYLKENYGKYLEEMTLISITGTNGKTTGAFIIYELLNKLGLKCGYVGTIGYYLDKFVCYLPNTTPDLCSMYQYVLDAYEKGYRYFVLEASSQGIDMGRLNTFTYNYVIFTNLTHEHLDYHKTMDEYMKVKLRIFENIRNGGLAIINSDDKYYKNFALDKNKNIFYGKDEKANYKISNPTYRLNETIFDLENDGIKHTIKSPLLGEYNIYNLIPAIIILDDLNISFDKYVSAIESLTSPDGRNEKIEYKTNLVVVDYAHTPDGIEKILEAYRNVKPNHLYTVFGACGNRDRSKRPIMLDIATKLSDFVIVTDYNLYGEDENQIINDVIKDAKRNNFKVIRNRKEAIGAGIKLLNEKDVLLILGKGHEKYLDIGGKKIYFDDREVAKEFISLEEVKN